ncbi:thioredoxin domain-containing protein [Micromonospora sp. NPDC005215]|uniref:DsbA family protein n=1 Tax=Micromonospora sp. NPDC005215 TaxID=3157024 RepID=UPI0033A5B8D7
MSSRKGKRDAARVVREQLARERRRRRTIWVSAAAVVVLVIAGVVGWVVWSNQRADTFTTPPGANAAGTGIVTGGGPVTVDVYEDFLCPVCKQFEQSTGATLEQLVADNKAKVVYHPVAFLNRFSTTEYSTRSSAASGCAAAGGKFREYARALFDRQPPEGSAGLADGELIDIGTEVGLDRGSFGGCVKDKTYQTWTAHLTEEASRSNVTGTPTVKVDGQPLDNPTPDALTAAVAAAGK